MHMQTIPFTSAQSDTHISNKQQQQQQQQYLYVYANPNLHMHIHKHAHEHAHYVIYICTLGHTYLHMTYHNKNSNNNAYASMLTHPQPMKHNFQHNPIIFTELKRDYWIVFTELAHYLLVSKHHG